MPSLQGIGFIRKELWGIFSGHRDPLMPFFDRAAAKSAA
jgi:hypothetical protein